MSMSNPESIKSSKQIGSAVSGSLVDIAPNISSSSVDEMEKEQKDRFKKGSFKSK